MRQNAADLCHINLYIRGYWRTHHENKVSGNAKHAQTSTEDGVVGFWEAVFHCSNFPTESRFGTLAMNIPLATSEAEERTTVTKAQVRG